MSLDKKVYGALRKYTDEKVKGIQTGNVTVEKTSDGVVFIAHKGEATETRAEFTQDELRGLGIESLSKDSDGNCIVTYTDGSTQNIGQWNGKNAAVEVVADTNFKYILKFSYYDKDDNLVEITTPNLRQNKVEIVPNTSNTENSYKLDINTYDAEGNKTTITTNELKAEKHVIKPNEGNNEYSYKIDLEKTNNDGTKETITTDNLKSNIWSGTDLTGDETRFEVLAGDGVNHSRVGELYINVNTDDIYRRTDKNGISDFWEKVGNIRGLQGDDAYEVAVGEGFVGTRSEWLKSLMGESLGSQIVWGKPNIHDETTLLKVWYYYKVDVSKYGEGSAWLNRYNIPSDKDYEPNTYSFFNGINYLTFTSTMAAIPSFTQKDTYQFYVLYDEKNSKARVHSVNKETNEDTSLGEWLDIIKSSTKPEGSELVIPYGNIIQYGTWVQTIYLGNSKENAYDCTIATGADVSGFITTQSFENVIGTENISDKFIKTTVNGRLGEVIDEFKKHSDDITKHITAAERTLWNTVSDKAKSADLTAHTINTEVHTTQAEKDSYFKKENIVKTIDETSTDDQVVGAKTIYEKTKNMCTTTVPDVGETNITSKVLNATVNYNGGVSYSVKNGICYVQFTSVTTTTASNGQYILPKGTLPSIDNSLSNGRYPVVGGGAKSGMVSVVGNTGGVRYYGGEMSIFTTISYPVIES